MKIASAIILIMLFILSFVATNLFLKNMELSRELSNLRFNLENLRANYNSLVADYNSLKERYEKVIDEKRALENELNNLEFQMQIFNVTLAKYKEAYDELSKLKEVLYYRPLRIYDYVKGTTYYELLYYPGDGYLYFRSIREHEPMTLSVRIDYVKKLVQDSVPSFRKIAQTMFKIRARGDSELYANMVLQIAHQLLYNETYYAKYPTETLVEGSGDCDNLAVLVATFLEAANIDAVIILAKTGSGAHALVGVHLPKQPDDLFKYGRVRVWYIVYNGKKYYLAEPTWDISKYDPFNPWIIGFFVGDNPWGEKLQIIKIIDV